MPERIEAVVSDFTGVLTTRSPVRWQQHGGVPRIEIQGAMRRLADRGEHPLFDLERGFISEREFLAMLEIELAAALGHAVQLSSLGALVVGELEPNNELFSYLCGLKERRGVRLAVLTNNVREWEPLWRSTLPIDGTFDLIVDSASVGMRKPEPEIYEHTLARLRVPAGAAVFIDDVDVNVTAAEELGMHALRFHNTAQAMGDLEALLRTHG